MNYYTPSPEKLAALGFAIAPKLSNIGQLWKRPAPHGNFYSIWVGLSDSKIQMAEEDAFDGEAYKSIDVRLRSEAEFDLLLWQIGWTDKEPA